MDIYSALWDWFLRCHALHNLEPYVVVVIKFGILFPSDIVAIIYTMSCICMLVNVPLRVQ